MPLKEYWEAEKLLLPHLPSTLTPAIKVVLTENYVSLFFLTVGGRLSPFIAAVRGHRSRLEL